MVKHIILLAGFAAVFASMHQGQTQKPEGTGTLRGVVVNQVTNEPISGVRIAIGKGNANAQLLLSAAQAERSKNARDSEVRSRLLEATANSLGGSDQGRDLNAVTGKDGRFAFEDIPPGDYPVSAELEGYVGVDNKKLPPVASATASVAPRQTTEIVLKLVPGAVLSGRIIDVNGTALTNATVDVLRRVDVEGTQSTEQFTQRVSDDRGEYRAFPLPPGEYFLVATPRESSSKRSGIRTYYPNAAQISGSTSFKVEPGDDLKGINIQILLAPVGNASPNNLPKN